jgi:hypothetical protein
MMKNLLLTLFTVLLASASFSQTNIDLECFFASPTTSPVTGTNIQFQLGVINNGPVAMSSGDAVPYSVTVNGTLAYSSAAFTIPAAGFPVGDTLYYPEITLNPASQPTAAQVDTVCAFTVPDAAVYTDVTPVNNVACYIWNRSLAGVNELSINEEINISAIYGVLKMTSTNQENYSYSVYSMAGQVISQGSFVNNKEVDMTGAAKGIYAVVVSNGTEKITKKIAIQ